MSFYPTLNHYDPLIESNRDITTYPCSQVDLGLEIQLDAKKQGSVLEPAIVINRSLDDGT